MGASFLVPNCWSIPYVYPHGTVRSNFTQYQVPNYRSAKCFEGYITLLTPGKDPAPAIFDRIIWPISDKFDRVTHLRDGYVSRSNTFPLPQRCGAQGRKFLFLLTDETICIASKLGQIMGRRFRRIDCQAASPVILVGQGCWQ